MTHRTWLAACLFLRLQWRCGLPQVVVGTALVTLLALRLAIARPLALWLLPPLLLTEACALTFALVAAQSYLERSEGSASALAATPLRASEAAVARVASASGVAVLGGAGVYAGVVGIDARLAAVALLLGLAAGVSGAIGLGLSTSHTQFTRFIVVAMTPALALLQLPLLAYADLVPRATFAWLPTDTALFALAHIVRGVPSALPLAGSSALLGVWLAAALYWAGGRVDAQQRGRLRPREIR